MNLYNTALFLRSAALAALIGTLLGIVVMGLIIAFA